MNRKGIALGVALGVLLAFLVALLFAPAGPPQPPVGAPTTSGVESTPAGHPEPASFSSAGPALPSEARAPVDASSLQVRVEVMSPGDAVAVTKPVARLRDPLDGLDRLVGPGEVLTLPRLPARVLVVSTVSDAWQVGSQQIDCGTVDGPQATITMFSRSLIRVDAVDWSTSAPVTGFRLMLFTEQTTGCCPMRSLAWQGSARPDASVVLLHGIPLTEGRFRVRSVDASRRGETPWMPFVHGREHAATLTLRDAADLSATLRIDVSGAATGGAVVGARVVATEEQYEAGLNPQARVRSFYDDGEGLLPSFNGADADHVPETIVEQANGNGRAELVVPALRPLVVAVSAPGYAARMQSVAPLPARGQASTAFVLQPESAVEGVVEWDRTDPALAPYLGVTHVELRNPEVMRTLRLGDDGSFLFAGVPAGDYTLAVIAIAKPGAGGAREPVEVAQRPVRLAAAERAQIAIKVGAAAGGATVLGSIVGLPIESPWSWTVAYVRADAPLGPPAGRTLVDPRGNFQISGLEAGNVRLFAMGRSIDGRGCALLEATVSLAPGAATQVVQLSSSAPPVWIDRQPGATGVRRFGCELAGVDAWLAFVANNLPPLLVDGGDRSVLYGFPRGQLTLRDDRGHVDLALPATGSIRVD